MTKPLLPLARLTPLLLILAAPSSYSQALAKKKVVSQADMPRHSYPVEGLASALAQADGATFGAFASRVRADIESDLRDYDIEDRSTLRDLLSAKLNLQELAGEHEAALATVEALRALEDKPSAKLTTGLLARAYLRAAIDTKQTAGPEFEEAFARRYGGDVNPLPWGVVHDWAKQSYASARLAARAVSLAFVMTELDPAVRKSRSLDESEAEALIRMRAYAQVFVPVSTAQAGVLRLYIAAHNTVKPDIWAAREVTLADDRPLTPVLVAIWDSGVDSTLFPGQFFDDPNPTVSGVHGLAFDDSGAPSTLWVYPLTPEQQARYPEIRDDVKGRLDIEEGYDSPEAVALEKKMKTSSPEQLHQLSEVR